MSPLIAPLFTIALALTVPAPSDAQDTVFRAGESDVLDAYRTNAALVDECYTNKRVAVTGRLRRIIDGRLDIPGTVYLLEMGPDGRTHLSFQFTAAERKRLAGLRIGDFVTVEGRCTGYAAQERDGYLWIDFWECNVRPAQPASGVLTRSSK